MADFFNAIFGGSDPTLNDAIKKEGGLRDYSTGVGQQGTTADLGYNLGILSGDPSKVAETLSPEIRQAQTNAQQNKNTVAQFGNRGGGMNSVMASLDDATRAKLLSLAGGLRQGAASELGKLGTANLGLAANENMDTAKLGEERFQNWLNSIFGQAIKGGVNYAESFLPIPHGG